MADGEAEGVVADVMAEEAAEPFPEAAAPAAEAAAAAPAPPEATTEAATAALPAADETQGGFQAYTAAQDLVKATEEAFKAAGRKPSYLVTMSLQASVEAGKDTFDIEAPGSHKLAFSSRLDDDDMPVLGAALQAVASCLSRLDLSCNLLTDAGAQTLASTLLSRATRLTSLSLRSNSIGPKGCAAVCEALRACPELRELDFAFNPLGREGGMCVVNFLRSSPNLLQLRLHDCEADIDAVIGVAEALLGTDMQLQVCNIENPRIQTLQEEHTVHLGRMLRVNANLTELSLGKIKMRDEGVRQLVSFLIENKTLRKLDLRCNELRSDGAKHLAILLEQDCQLSALDVSSNSLGHMSNVDGAKAIARALTCNRMLQELSLDRNSLCGEALQAIADAIDQNSTLKLITLYHNAWDVASSQKFQEIVADRTRITELKSMGVAPGVRH